MPAKEVGARVVLDRRGQCRQLLTVKAIVRLTIEPQLLDLAADEDTVLRRDGHESDVEKLVKISAQKESVESVVQSISHHRFDVCGLENRKRAFARDCAAPSVRICHQRAKRRLPSARSHEHGLAEFNRSLRCASLEIELRVESALDCIPKSASDRFRSIERLAGHRTTSGELTIYGDPALAREEEGR